MNQSSNTQNEYQRLIDYNEILSQEDMNILAPLTYNNKISISYPDRLMNIMWDSLTNSDIELIFQISAVRKVFKKEIELNEFKSKSKIYTNVTKGRWQIMMTEYNRYLGDSLSQKYSWNGKQVTYKQYRDSLSKSYHEFSDSLRKESLKKGKSKTP